MSDAFDRVWDVSQERGISLRDAALVAAIREVSGRARGARGLPVTTTRLAATRWCPSRSRSTSARPRRRRARRCRATTVRAVLVTRRRQARRRRDAQDARARGRRAGRDPSTTTLGEIAEEPNATIDSAMPLDEAFALPRGAGLRARPGRRGRQARRRALALGRAAAARRGREPPDADGTAASWLGRDRGRRDLRDERLRARRASPARTSSSASRPSSSNFSCAWPTASSASVTRAPIAPSTLRSSAAAQTPPNAPALELITATGLLRNDVRRERPRGPVERVLERARDRRVVLGRGEEDGVGLAHAARGSASTSRRARHDVVVLRRRAGSPCRPSQSSTLDPRRRLLAQRAEETPCCSSRRGASR